MTIESARAVLVQEDRPGRSLADVEIEGPCRPRRQRDSGGLVAFAMDERGAVASVDVEVVDVGAEGFGDAQPVQCEQARECVIPSTAESGLDEERAEFVAIEAEGGGLVVLFRATDMGGWVAFDQPLLGAPTS